MPDELTPITQRFCTQIRTQAGYVNRVFAVPFEDALQEARILILSYAGIVKARHYQILEQMEKEADNLEALVGTQLRRDLCEFYGRKEKPTVSLEELPPAVSVDNCMEEAMIRELDRTEYLFRDYPMLTLHYIRRMTAEEIAESENLTVGIVKWRIYKETKRAREDQKLYRYLKGVVEEG